MTALREYAPGAEVVIDGQVYVSKGITLNWHAPASVADIQEIQSIRYAWRCGGKNGCGASGTSQAKIPAHCPECSNSISSNTDQSLTYLDPAGFAVDLYDDLITMLVRKYLCQWKDLGLMSKENGCLWLILPLECFVVALQVLCFITQRITWYGLCNLPECGRAEPMPIRDEDDEDVSTNSRPKAFQEPHKRLRGAQGGETRMCEGSAYAIKSDLQLGHEIIADVLELVLLSLDGQAIPKQAAYSLAVALREGILSNLE